MSNKDCTSFSTTSRSNLLKDKLYGTISYLDLTEESIIDSQNFQLRIADDSDLEHKTQIVNDTEEIIVLSDSSFVSSPKMEHSAQSKKNTLNYQKRNENNVFILESSESNLEESEDEKFFQEWRTKRKALIGSKFKYSENESMRQNSKLISSDDTSCDSNVSEKEHSSEKSNKSPSTPVSMTQEMQENVESIINKFQNLNKGNLPNKSSTFSSNSKSSSQFSTPSRHKAIDSPHISSGSVKKLTKKDTYSILKNIKSTKAVYESPRLNKNDKVLVNETLDEDFHPAISPTNQLRTKAVIISETPPDTKNDEAVSNNTNVLKQLELFGKEISDKTGAHHGCTELSARKRNQISEWLMHNSPNASSDSSFSCVPPSNRSSINSGNSSLERLEMNYETPNNRGKLSKLQQKDIGSNTKEDNKTAPIKAKECSSSTNLHENICRKNYIRNLPLSESRIKHNNVHKTKEIQTERKTTAKKKWILKSDEEDSVSSCGGVLSENNSTSKTVRRRKKKNDSFINDSSSESDSRDLYYTALTNPRPSANLQPKPTALPTSAQRVLALCDSETEEDDCCNNIKQKDLQRRKLLYSDDEDDIKSSTSEFDPGDYVPPKILPKKEIKAPRQIVKGNTERKVLPSNYQLDKTKKTESFLASLSEAVPLACAHPDARKYRTNFKNSKDDLCKYLYKFYNERVFEKQLPQDMPLEWNVRMRGTAGYCYNKKSVKTLGGIVRSSRIVLATKVLDTPDRLRDTLIHEMCHAAAWLINNVSDGHGAFWTAWANKAMKTFPELPPIRRCHDYEIKTKFTYKCTGCGYSIGRHSKSLDVERKRCGHCYGKFELLVNKTTKFGTVQMQTPKKEPSAFALFVKENYNSVKKEHKAKHGEVMKILGQQFSAVKLAKNNHDKENCPNNSS